MIVVDTTVLVYAAGADHPLREPCRRLIELVGDGEVAATTTIEVIQEVCHVRARRRDRTDAARLALDYMALLTPLVAVDADDLRAGIDLFVAHERLGAFDAVLAAVARRAAGGRLVSADAAFADVEGLEHLDPAAEDFLDRLTGA